MMWMLRLYICTSTMEAVSVAATRSEMVEMAGASSVLSSAAVAIGEQSRVVKTAINRVVKTDLPLIIIVVPFESLIVIMPRLGAW